MYDLLASQPLAVRFFIAFLVVLILIGVTAWLVRRFGRNSIGGSNARGRQPRLAVIDVTQVDSRRRLVLIRRDNVEHLLMIGGPSDVVVEPNIVRAMSAASREPTRAEAMARPAPPADTAWPLQLTNEQVPPARHRTPPAEESWPAPETSSRGRGSDTLTGLAAELTARLAPHEAAPAPRGEPQRAAAPPPLAPEPPAPPQSDQNLAEMAQALEAALRRGPAAEGRPPVTDPLAVSPPGKPAETPRPAPREFKARAEPKFDARPEAKSWFEQKFEPRPEPKLEPKVEAKIEPAPAPASASGKTPYENLEDEMASLLGRPAAKG